MKTYTIPCETVAEVYRDVALTANPAVHAVTPIPVVFEGDPPTTEALNAEIGELKDIAWRALRREFEAVRRCEALREQLEAITGAIEEGCNSEGTYAVSLARGARRALEIYDETRT